MSKHYSFTISKNYSHKKPCFPWKQHIFTQNDIFSGFNFKHHKSPGWDMCLVWDWVPSLCILGWWSISDIHAVDNTLKRKILCCIIDIQCCLLLFLLLLVLFGLILYMLLTLESTSTVILSMTSTKISFFLNSCEVNVLLQHSARWSCD